MILVFGGTTEGRKTAEVLEEAGKPYFYSTWGEGQHIELVHGKRLSGAMDAPAIIRFCRDNAIRLIIDAAHPFAVELHANLLCAAHRVGINVVRYERQYPPRTEDCIWCKDYQDAICRLQEHGIERLLALTGVNTIRSLRPYWETHKCWFRILNRQGSKKLALANQFPENYLVYYESDNTDKLIEQLQPQAILTKESGKSGGFLGKVADAKNRHVKVFVIERPAYPPHATFPYNVKIEIVDGPYGLRRMVERLLPEFYTLHSGLTTGTCATAAAVAATCRLLKNEMPTTVPVILPNGETIRVAVGHGDNYSYCIKEAGDDPDVTNGVEIRAMAGFSDSFEIKGGDGIGRFTLPGFDYAPGEAAINRVPRQMIEENVGALTHVPVSVTISVPAGAEIAKRTFNPRLGIEGGISIIGVTGIVKPFSEEAFIDSIRKCMQVAKASGSDFVVINSGGKSERFVRQRYPFLPKQTFVEYGNYIGKTLEMAHELAFQNVVLGVMLGKAVKLAEGQLDTHSRKGTMNKDFINMMLAEADCSVTTNYTLARELWQLIPSEHIEDFCKVVLRRCMRQCQPLVPNQKLTLLLIGDDGTIHSL